MDRSPPLRIATRGSELAQWQARSIAAALSLADPAVRVELVVISTEGDRRHDVPLQQIGGKGVFVKEVQAAVLDGRADLAVHSAKDLPAETPDGLVIAAVPERADARDALVGDRLADLRPGAIVATGAPRRRAQLEALRPDLVFAELRGNIDTRLAKAHEFDAIVMAMAALVRLDRHPEIVDPLGVDEMVPQVGQGALAIECRADDLAVRRALASIEHAPSRQVVDAERSFLLRLGGDCDLPAGAHATLGERGLIVLDAVLAVEPGRPLRRITTSGNDPREVGESAAAALLVAGS